MIKSEELMLGNWVNRKESLCNDKIGFVQWTESDWYRIGECIDFFESYEPIELTEELLLKCGLAKNAKGEFVYELNFRFTWKPSYKYFYVTTWENDDYVTKIEFLHELQNFIFINCGKHLEIEL